MRQILQRAGWGLYELASGLGLVASAPWVLWRRGGHYRETVLPRLGQYGKRDALQPTPSSGSPGRLWIHAVSVGEVGVAATLVSALPQELPLVVTTITPTGQELARKLFAGRGEVAYFPFDLGFAVHRFLRRFSPVALVLTEGDLWPNLLRIVRSQGIPMRVINGRVSDRSFARMKRIRFALRPLFQPVDAFGMQTAGDRSRLLALGIPEEKVSVTGNLKYETPEPPPLPELQQRLEALAAGRSILLAGSTMAGEEEQVLAAVAGQPETESALLVVAPRHPERWQAVADLLERRGLRFLRRSRWQDVGLDDRPQVVLLDSLGELASAYRWASAAFIGGTLVPTGGHNPLEAARFGVPTVVGPAMENFREMAQRFDAAGAWSRAEDGPHLGRIWASWLKNPAAAREVGSRGAALVEENRGALRRTLEVLDPLLSSLGVSLLEELREVPAAGAPQSSSRPAPLHPRSPRSEDG